jgi:tRNA(Ile)-lysidine synthase
VLAVSGGLDSMVLLDAAARVARDRIAVVATFDHGSGPHAARGVSFVCDEAAARCLPVVVGRAPRLPRREAAWREARWRFLCDVASRVGAAVATAHTEDDQVETVLMRALRGAGPRGLAGLYAERAGVERPLLDLRRAALEAYARGRGVRWLDDPTNRSMRFLRNRVRNDLLPALRLARPSIDDDLLALARRAAAWRADVDALAEHLATYAGGPDASTVSVALADLAGYDPKALGVLWPAIAARVGLAMDRRGTRRLIEFTTSTGKPGASMQLAGGWEVVRHRGRLTLRRARGAAAAPVGLPRAGAVRWGRWSFARAAEANVGDLWRAALPAGRPLVVRSWRPGDRMTGSAGKRRRVKRFLGDAGIVGPDRVDWPVVLADGEIVWIPGIGRAAAATASQGTSGLIYSCELNDR